MKINVVLVILIAAIISLSGQASLFAQDSSVVLEQFKKSFPQVKVDEFSKIDIDGLYEIVSGGRVLYYFPQKNYLFAGAIWTPAGKNLTNARESELLTKKIKEISLKNALKIGSGENIVLEFTNPDCSYCRQASKFFSEKKNVTRYVYFLFSSKDSEKKVKHVLCAKDKAKAYEEAMTGKLDGKKLEACNDEKAVMLLNEHKQTVSRLGLNSTPQFWVNGKHVSGANIPLLESLLKNETTK
jgi:thiol:disulfide interchange protein DsbC